MFIPIIIAYTTISHIMGTVEIHSEIDFEKYTVYVSMYIVNTITLADSTENANTYLN